MFKKALMKISVIGIAGAAFAACGVVDVEQAQGVVDLRARILEIQTNEVDPLVEQIDAIEEQVAPIEAEIEALERQKEDLYQQAEEMGQKFDEEMRERFDTAYMEGDQARAEFEKEIEAKYRELDERERELKDERRRLHEELEEAHHQKRQEMEERGQDTWEALEFEMRGKEEEAQKVSKSMWRAWDDEREEAHDQVEQLRREFEENNPFNMEMEAIHQAWKDIDDLYFEIDVEQMQIEEDRMELHDMMKPLEEQAQELRRMKREIQDQDPATFARIAGSSGSGQNSGDMIREQHDKLDDLRRQLREAVDEQQQTQTAPKQLDWDRHAAETEKIWADYDIRIEEIASKRTDSFDANAAVGDANNAQLDIENINNNYREQEAYHEAMLGQVMEKLQDLESGTSDDSAQRSQLIAEIESHRSQLDSLNQVLTSTPAVLQRSDPNPDWDDKVAALSDAESALANTPATINPDADGDGTIDTNADGSPVATGVALNADGTIPDSVTNPVYANALAVVESAKAELENTPQNIVTEYPNPAQDGILSQIEPLNSKISELESALHSISDQPTSADPAYTAALAEKNEIDSILNDLRNEWTAEIQAKQSVIDAAATGAPDQGKLEGEIQNLFAQAEIDRNNALAALDAEYTVTENTSTSNSGGEAERIRDEIENVENYIADLHNSKDQARNAKQQVLDELRGEFHEIQDQLEAFHGFMRELEDQHRPLHEKRMALDKERMVLEQKQREIEDQRGPWEEERRRYEDNLWKGFDDWQHTRQQEIEDQQEQMWDLVRVSMDDKRRETEKGMKQMWRDFDNETRDAHKNIDKEAKERFKTEIEDVRRELDSNRENLQQAFEAEREVTINEIESMRDELYEERLAPIEAELAELDEEISAKFESIEGLYEQQEQLASQLEELEAQVRELDQEAEFGLLSVISGAIENAEKLEQNPASLAGTAGVSLTDFLPAPPSRE